MPRLLLNEEYYSIISQKPPYTDAMTDREKLCAVQKYVSDNYDYAHMKCTGGAKLLLIAARNLGLECHYRHAGPDYDLYGEKGSAVDAWSHISCGAIGGHVAVVVDFDASPYPLVIDASGHY